MDVLFFETFAVSFDMREHVLFAFFDGSIDDPAQYPKLVTMLRCRVETAQALRSAIRAALAEKD